MFANSFLDQNFPLEQRKEQGPAQQSLMKSFKDFTLTNVRKTAKVMEIKMAIEKLKGFRIECQSLNLVDEIDLLDPQSKMRSMILDPLIDQVAGDGDRT